MESVCVGNCTEGSNPSLSATYTDSPEPCPWGAPDGGSGPTRCVGFEPGQAGNGAALRILTQVRGARALRRARPFLSEGRGADLGAVLRVLAGLPARATWLIRATVPIRATVLIRAAVPIRANMLIR